MDTDYRGKELEALRVGLAQAHGELAQFRAENGRLQQGREVDDQAIRQLRAERDRWKGVAKARHEELVRLENLCASRSKELEELQKNYDGRGEELGARGEELEAIGIELAHLRRMRATEEEWTRDDTIRKLRAQLARAQGEVAQLLAQQAQLLCEREKASADLRDALAAAANLRVERDNSREEARRAWAARGAVVGALGICGESWMPMTGDGPEAVRCTQVCSLPVGHKGAHGWGRNVQATTVQATKDPA